jgi:hypothetical protein
MFYLGSVEDNRMDTGKYIGGSIWQFKLGFLKKRRISLPCLKPRRRGNLLV